MREKDKNAKQFLRSPSASSGQNEVKMLKKKKKPTVLFKEPNYCVGVKKELPALSLGYVRFHVVLEGSGGGTEL